MADTNAGTSGRSLAERLQEGISGTPIGTLLDARVRGVGADRATVEMASALEVKQSPRGKLMHGVVIPYVMDAAAGCAALSALRTNAVTTAQYSVNVVAPPRFDKLKAKAKVVSKTKSTATLQVEAYGTRGGKKVVCAIGQWTVVRK